MPYVTKVFISSTTADLSTFRKQVGEWLLDMGWQPIFQDHFSPDDTTVTAMLRKRIRDCDAVLHLVGECYGAEPRAPVAGGTRQSYTQIEATIGRQLRKRVFVVLLDSKFPYDSHPPEAAELRDLQDAYRLGVKSGSHLYIPCSSPSALEPHIRKLPVEIDKLRRTQRGLRAIFSLLLIAAIAIGYYVWHLGRAAEISSQRLESMQHAVDASNQKLEAFHDDIREIIKQAAQKQMPPANAPDNHDSPKQQVARALDQVAEERGLDPATVKAATEKFEADTSANSSASLQDQALAALAAGDFAKAEKLGLDAAGEAIAKPTSDDRNRVVARDMFMFAARAAVDQERWVDAKNHFLQALDHTNANLDSALRAQLAWEVIILSARAAYDSGDFAKAETLALDAVRSASGLDLDDKNKRTAVYFSYVLAGMVAAKGDHPADADKRYRLALGLFKPDAEPKAYAEAADGIAISLDRQQRFGDAADFASEAKAVIGERFGELGEVARRYMEVLALDQLWAHRYSASEATLRESLPMLGDNPQDVPAVRLVGIHSRLAVVLEKQGKTKEAEDARLKSVAIIAAVRSHYGDKSDLAVSCDREVENAKEDGEMETQLKTDIYAVKKDIDKKERIIEQLTAQIEQTKKETERLEREAREIAATKEEAKRLERELDRVKTETKEINDAASLLESQIANWKASTANSTLEDARIKNYLELFHAFVVSCDAKDRLITKFRISAGIFTAITVVAIILAMFQSHRAKHATVVERIVLKHSWLHQHRRLLSFSAIACATLALAFWSTLDLSADAVSGRNVSFQTLESYQRETVSFAEKTESSNYLSELELFAATLRLDPRERHFDEAANAYVRIIGVREKDASFDRSKLAKLMDNLAATLTQSGKNDEAASWYRRANELKTPATTPPATP